MIVFFAVTVKEIRELARVPRAGARLADMALPRLILASTSPYRRELLARLRLPFEALSPGVDETARAGEAPAALAVRLAEEKAHAVAVRHPEAIVVGGDQVAVLDGRALGKPETHANAIAQLRAMRGRRVSFLTAVAVERAASGERRSRLVPCDVEFRDFPESAIEPYLAADRPYDCAGSAKIDGLGIALVARLDGEDPTALVGLPLIALVALLAELGLDVLRPA
jgi:septum formation protein